MPRQSGYALSGGRPIPARCPRNSSLSTSIGIHVTAPLPRHNLPGIPFVPTTGMICGARGEFPKCCNRYEFAKNQWGAV